MLNVLVDTDDSSGYPRFAIKAGAFMLQADKVHVSRYENVGNVSRY
jgi:hypothetical protein